MPNSIDIKLSDDVGGGTFAIRKFVSRKIDHDFLAMQADLKKKKDDDEDVSQSELIDFLVLQMVLEPKLTKESLEEMNTRAVEALYYAIIEETKYEEGDFIGMIDDLQIDPDELDDEKLMKRKAIEYQRKRVNSIKKKHTVQ